ncbi:PapB/FocB family fimbrial expression transcriptional regulator [Escherichia coli]|uniref:PapB/FocB family fimbrial expression transcriptional regulator n=1 Tax=Escherichia coli TaxID=562 RepID=UPI002452BEA9|nr:PapB/FocB family fimbrial expression transcriptional regulator [Escherichia coli]
MPLGIYHSRVAGIYDTPGSMSDAHFEILAALSPVNSKKVILALRDYFVLGLTRREACENHDVAQGYFSVSLRKLLETNRLVVELAVYYQPSHQAHQENENREEAHHRQYYR